MDWIKEMECGVTVCDLDANIVYMNDKAKRIFERFGPDFVGHNLKEFHGERSWGMICDMLKNNKSNHYTVTRVNKQNVIVHQNPWYENEVLKGLVEFSFEILVDMPHFDRSK